MNLFCLKTWDEDCGEWFVCECVIVKDHIFPRYAEFWAEPRNLPVSTEFLHFHRISRNLVLAGIVIDINSLAGNGESFATVSSSDEDVHRPIPVLSVDVEWSFRKYGSILSPLRQNLRTVWKHIVYVAAKATYIRLLHGKICFLWGFFGPRSVKRGWTQ